MVYPIVMPVTVALPEHEVKTKCFLTKIGFLGTRIKPSSKNWIFHIYNLLKLYITSASKYSLLAALEIRGNMFYEAVYEDN